MADCGATGSVLDRTARAMLGANGSRNSDASKGMASLMGHAVAGKTFAQQQQSAPMPMGAPRHMVLPGNGNGGGIGIAHPNAVTSASASPHTMEDAQRQQHVQVQAQAQMASQHSQAQQMHSPRMQQQQQHHHPQQHHQQQQQHQQQMMAAQQQQQQQQQFMMMQQQQQQQMHLRQQQQQQQYQQQQQQQAAQQQASATQNAQNQNQNQHSDAASEWHEGLEDQAKEATMEDLSAAWAHSEAEYNQGEAATNVWTQGQGHEHEGLEDQAKEELRRHLESLQQQQQQEDGGHEGLLQGATMEDLAAAWAHSEAEYDQVEAATNLWSQGQGQGQGVDGQGVDGQTAAATYQFINTSVPSDADVKQEQQDWMQEGMEQFNAGNLKEAIRAFEMELQHGNSDNASAWRMLGRCHAENDMDREAIVCLEQAVDRDPYSPEALLALGVSYVNELNHARAIETLKAWIQNNPKFAGLELEDDLYGAAEPKEPGMESAFDEVQQLLLRALEFDPNDAADVLEALGVVYNVSRDYDAAVDAFEKAIQLRPDDYQLWNKVGATLANSNQSAKALLAYHKALQLKPKYARVWLNMAISHSNLQNYEEAARCYLQTLSLNPSAIHCWSYLRIALSCSERWDLLPLATSQDLDSFSEHFDFIRYNSGDGTEMYKSGDGTATK